MGECPLGETNPFYFPTSGLLSFIKDVVEVVVLYNNYQNTLCILYSFIKFLAQTNAKLMKFFHSNLKTR